MTISDATSISVPSAPAQVIRTGWEECNARFHPEHYQLVLERNGGEEKIELSYSGSRLLERLLQTPGDVVTREELLAYAWADRVVGQGSLNQQVYCLRQLLGDEKRREIIQTLPRRGYMFNPNSLVVPAEPERADTEAQSHLHSPLRRAPMTPARRLLYGALDGGGALLCLAVLAAVTVHYSLFHTPVASADRQIGNLRIFYGSPADSDLAALMDGTSALDERLAALAERPVEVRLNKTAEFYELLCLRSQGARWLKIHEQQLAHVDTTLLRECLQ